MSGTAPRASSISGLAAADETGALPRRFGRADGYMWGFVSQSFSSATNLGLAVLAARILGPTGLGTVTIAFSLYVSCLALQRALVTDPLMANSAPLGTDPRRCATENALTVAIVGAVGASGLALIAGISLGGGIGIAILIAVPWVPMALMQDYWRSILFRDGRAVAAATNDAVWLVAMAIASPFAFASGALWAVVAVWGIGALAGTTLGIFQTRCRPRIKGSFNWWRTELWPLGRWLGVNSIGHTLAVFALVFALVSLFGTDGLGGYRAVATAFAPLTLIASAIALPGLPALVRAQANSASDSLRLAKQLGMMAFVATAVYVAVLSVGNGALIPWLFGSSFQEFTGLIWPVGIAQSVTGMAVGFALLLKAQSRGSAVLFSDSAASIAALGLSCGLGAAYGLTAAVWGLAGGAVVWAATTFALVRRS